MTAWIVRDRLECRPAPDAFTALLRSCGSRDPEWLTIVATIDRAARSGCSVAELADRLGLSKGVTGYNYHTVPVVAYAWFRHCGDFRQTLTAVLDCGGDTDTTGAIAGALAGATVGEEGIPEEWRASVTDWPRSLPLLRALAGRLATAANSSRSMAPVHYCWPAIPLRNLAFLLIVLAHGFRRLLPPH